MAAAARAWYQDVVADDLEPALATVRGWIDAARRIVVLTGAGISTDSGIPDFRGPRGVWTRNPAEINWPLTVLLGWCNDLRRDFTFCARKGQLLEFPHAAQIRWQQRRAKLADRDSEGEYCAHQQRWE